MSFLLEKAYPMLSNPDTFKRTVYLTKEQAMAAGLSTPTEHYIAQAKWDLANGYKISVVCGTHTYGGDRGLFEAALLHKDGTVEEPTGHLTEGQVEKLLQAMRKKHGAKV